MLILLIIILSIDEKKKAASKHMKAEAKSKWKFIKEKERKYY